MQDTTSAEGSCLNNRECDGCGPAIGPGEWRFAITGKYNDEIGTRYFSDTKFPLTGPTGVAGDLCSCNWVLVLPSTAAVVTGGAATST